MNNLVLYTKTYSADIERLKVSIESIKKHNKDNIKYYISVPKNEILLFRNSIDCDYVNILTDEEIYPVSSQNWNTQQIVKSSFWKLNLCENYVMLDSDSYFIRDFYYKDFMYDSTTPYTVMHEQKDLFDWSCINSSILGYDPYDSFVETRLPIMKLFDRQGRVYDFGPGPVIWSKKVWKSLEENYLVPNNITFAELIKNVPSEFTWYGEYLLASKCMDIIPIEPIFKFFHYKQQYVHYKNNGYTEENFKQNYLGVVMQSNWNAPLKY
jgi:hypothetical protein